MVFVVMPLDECGAAAFKETFSQTVGDGDQDPFGVAEGVFTLDVGGQFLLEGAEVELTAFDGP